ncbi:MAG: biotin synthase, partial [Inconstantimicrobium porci]|nr:biotin synthase [Inconstantimicrobium porci]
GVVLKRAQYFITCRGKYYGSVDFDDEKIKKALMPKVDLNIIDNEGVQLSFFDNASESNDIIKKNDNEISKLLLNMDSDNSTNDILLPDKKILLLDDKSTAITGEL